MKKDEKIKRLEKLLKSERRYRIYQLLPCLACVLLGIFSIRIGYVFVGIGIIITGIILYLKILQLSFTRQRETENLLIEIKNKIEL